MSLSRFVLATVVLFGLSTCDFVAPRKSYRIAVGGNDFTYSYMAGHLEQLMKKKGYEVTVVKTANTLEANAMVARGDAELTFLMNSSMFVPSVLGEQAGKLRTVVPITERLLLLFAKEPMAKDSSLSTLFKESIFGIELLNGETEKHFLQMTRLAGIDSVHLIQLPKPVMQLDGMEDAGATEVIHIWGTNYGPRSKKLLNDGWQPISLPEDWIDFFVLNEPSLKPFTLPAIPGKSQFPEIRTVSSTTLLVCREDLGENAIYQLTQTLFASKMELMRFDPMYRTLHEPFVLDEPIYPVHAGADAYLRRNEPSFLERYADAIALLLSFGAVMYGVFQTLQNTIRRRRKERLDLYFLEFSDIRAQQGLSPSDKWSRLDALLQRALVQMTNEKLEKSDFHILSRLVQQEMTNLK